MSDEDLYGRPAKEYEAGYVEMSPDPRLPKEPDEEPEIYNSDRAGLLDATEDLIKSRGVKNEPDVIDRGYVKVGGENAGEPVELNRTLDINRAADDLRAVRDAEVQAIENSENEHLAKVLDEVTGVATTAEVDAWIEQQKAAQQQTVTDNPPPPPPGVNEELYTLLMKNPVAAKALEAEVAQVTKAQKQFADAAEQNARFLAASLVADIPELQNLDLSQYGLALDIVAKSNPQRAADLRARFSKIEQLYQVSQHARAQQTQAQAQSEQARLQSWRAQETGKFDRWVASNPQNAQRVKAVLPQAAELLAEYGMSKADVEFLRSQPLVQSDIGSRILLDAMTYRQALRTATSNRAAAPVLPVQRPGTAPARYSAGDGDVDAASQEFRRNPTPRNAARMVAARRRAS